jgi:hypothetical protein
MGSVQCQANVDIVEKHRRTRRPPVDVGHACRSSLVDTVICTAVSLNVGGSSVEKPDEMKEEHHAS